MAERKINSSKVGTVSRLRSQHLLLLLLFLLVVAFAQGTTLSCRDDSLCSLAASEGDCWNEPEYMLEHCPKACRNPCLCDVSAFTNDTACDCIIKAKNGSCNQTEIQRVCSTTCATVTHGPCLLLPLPADPNASLSTWSNDYGTVVTEVCNRGYSPSVDTDQGMKTCSASGQWLVDSIFGGPIVCVPVDCGRPPSSLNSDWIAFETTFNKTAVYHCERNFIPDSGQINLTCNSSGLWEGDPLKCRPVNCGEPPSSPNATYTTTNTTLGGVATYNCSTGFQFVSGDLYLACSLSEIWQGNLIVCEEINCGEPPSSPNATYTTTNTTLGGVATYNCSTGFQFVSGDLSLACSLSEIWQGSLIVCEEVNCGEPPSSPNATYTTTNTTLGGVATYNCSTGFQFVSGDLSLACSLSEIWQGSLIVCEVNEVNCGEPPSSPNATYTTTNTTLGGVATYNCSTGFQFVSGDLSLACSLSEIWQGSLIVCEAIDCGNPPWSPNTHSDAPETTYGNTATYECAQGHVYDLGETTLTCNASGLWEGQPLTCRAIDCGNPPNIPNAQVDSTGTSYSQSANYSCLPGFENELGQNILICDLSGNWAGDPLKCHATDIQTPQADNSGSMTVVIAWAVGAAIFLIFIIIIIAWVLKTGARRNSNKSEVITRNSLNSLFSVQVWNSINAQMGSGQFENHNLEPRTTKLDITSDKSPTSLRATEANSFVSMTPKINSQITHITPSPDLTPPDPQETFPGPQETSPGSQKTSSGPQKTSRGPQKTSSGPQKTSRGPQKTSSSPDLMSTSTFVTPPATYRPTSAPSNHLLRGSSPPLSVPTSPSSATTSSYSHTSTPESLPEVSSL